MALVCPEMTLTFYPGSPGDTESPLVMLSPEDRVESSSLRILQRQIVEASNEVRAPSGDNFLRKNNRTTLSWETVRDERDPTEQLKQVIAEAIALPGEKGWVLIEITGDSQTYEIPNVILPEAGGSPRYHEGILLHPWTISGGKIAVHSVAADPETYPYAILTEAGFVLGTEDGNYFAQEDLTT